MPEKLSNRAIWMMAIILLLTILVYIPSLNNDFTNWDDLEQVVNNEDIRGLTFTNTKTVFSSFYVGMYQPITAQLYTFIYTVFGPGATAFHVVSLLLHLLNVILVFFLVRIFSRKEFPALITAALFSLNPLQTESVAWVSAMSNLLFTSFFLAGLITYIRYARNGKLNAYLLSLLWFVLSMLSKPAAATFPVIIIFIDIYFRRKLQLRLILEKLPFFIIAIIIGLVVIMARDEAGHIIDISERYSWADRFFMVSYALSFYVARLIIPTGLSAFHPYPTEGLPMVFYIAPLIPIMVIFMLYRLKGELRRQVMVGLMFFIITIALVLELIPLGVQVVKERYVYLPSIGIYYAFAVLLLFFTETSRRKSWMAPLIVGCMAVIFAVLSFGRVQTWHDSISLWDDVLESYPSASAALINRGNAWQEQEKYNTAISDYSMAVQYEPMAADAFMNRGLAYFRMDNHAEATKDFDRAIALGMSDADTYLNRGLIRAAASDIPGAMADFEQAVKIDPENEGAWVSLGLVQARLSMLNEAYESFSSALKAAPSSARAYYWRGMLQLQLGNKDEACHDLQAAMSYGWPREQVPEICQ